MTINLSREIAPNGDDVKCETNNNGRRGVLNIGEGYTRIIREKKNQRDLSSAATMSSTAPRQGCRNPRPGLRHSSVIFQHLPKFNPPIDGRSVNRGEIERTHVSGSNVIVSTDRRLGIMHNIPYSSIIALYWRFADRDLTVIQYSPSTINT